jgi:hypothetical protein
VWLDRLGSDLLVEALESDDYSFLPTLVRLQPEAGTLDLRFRTNSKTGTSWATLYAGERALLTLFASREGKLCLRGSTPIEAFSPEGTVHAALCSRRANAVLDRETAFRFNSRVERDSTLAAVRAPLKAALDMYVASATKALPRRPNLGQEVDAIAVEPDGALAIIEVKPKTQTGDIGWTPAQATMYARIFEHWIDCDPPAASEALRKMLAQRIRLRLGPVVALAEPIRIRPVIALETGLTNKVEAQARAEQLQNHLLRSGVGYANLEARTINGDGSTTDLQWFRSTSP